MATLLGPLALGGCAAGPPGEGIVTGSIGQPAGGAFKLPALPSLSGGAVADKVERVGSNLYRVPAADRRIDDRIQRENYALLRAAETARDAGATHFVVVNAEARAGSGPLGLGSGSELGTLIRVITLVPGGEPPIGAVDAGEIIHFFGPNFGRPAPAGRS